MWQEKATGLSSLPPDLSSPISSLDVISHCLSWYVNEVNVNLEHSGGMQSRVS